MKAQIIPIGNSKGIRIPKMILEQCHFGGTVELEVKNHQLIIRASKAVRQGWDQAFAEMREHQDDVLLDQDKHVSNT